MHNIITMGNKEGTLHAIHSPWEQAVSINGICYTPNIDIGCFSKNFFSLLFYKSYAKTLSQHAQNT
jgi:hypothetical protein